MTNTNSLSSKYGKSPVRSSGASQLHSIICGLCFEANSEENVAAYSAKLERFFESEGKRNPRLLLELSANDCSHLVDALHFPFEPNIPCPDHLRMRKADMLLQALIDFGSNAVESEAITPHEYAKLFTQANKNGFTALHDAIKTGNTILYQKIRDELDMLREAEFITPQEYAQQFTQQTIDRFAPLHTAIKSGNVELYDSVLTELKALRDKGTLTPQEYAQQFTAETTDRFTLLHTAIKTGNTQIYNSMLAELKALQGEGALTVQDYARHFTAETSDKFTPLHAIFVEGNKDMLHSYLTEIKTLFSREQRQHLLLQSTKGNWNMFHSATKPDITRETPNPFMVDMLIGAFYDAFGRDAKQVIAGLYRQNTEYGHTPYHERQPYWLKDILSLSEPFNDPLRPTRTYHSRN